MLRVLLLLAAVAASQQDAVTKQLPTYKSCRKGPVGIMTTSSGAPVEYAEATSSLNTNLLSNEHLFDSMTNFVRARIPERIVHAGGTGAFGYFETTHDISNICSAKVFSKVGKKTPVASRFSLGFSRSAMRDTSRENKGIAVKFYTEEGNWDLTTLHVPIFVFSDPLLFASLRVVQLNPATDCPDPNMQWDLLTQRPESLYGILYLYSDYGTPVGYPYMPGHAIHTYQVYNKKGESHYVRFHLIPEAGIKNFNSTQATEVGSDPNYYKRSLYNAIANGDYPSWILKIQVLTENDVKKAKVNVFDVTSDLPEEDYPMQPVGRLVLNKNPVNQFAEIEQIAFSPGNIVPGIAGGLGKLYEARRFVYRDAHNYRLNGNAQKIKVNCPLQNPALTYTRDGFPPVNDNGGDGPNYYPNSFYGPVPYVDKNRPKLKEVVEKAPNNTALSNRFYTKILTSEERTGLVQNLVESLRECEEFIQKRAIKAFTHINSKLGSRIAEGLASHSSS